MVEIIKSPSDAREYRSLVLHNGLKVMLVFDAQASQASAAIDIQVGSAHDPKTRQGLAHLLEHMLFLGTSKYPGAGEYQQFINGHGGTYNASTALNSTHYFFTLPSPYLEPALDQFSRFFIDPLFDQDAIEREIAIVHSEFMARKVDDASRLDAARTMLLNAQHPFTNFAAGNQQTLTEDQVTSVRDDLLDFFHSYYHAQRMALVVVSPFEPDQMQAWVEQRFGSIASQGEPYAPFSASLFDADQAPSILTLKPVKDAAQVTFCFPVASVYGCDGSKPTDYLASLIAFKGRGSLIDLLRQKGWADSIAADLRYSDENGACFEVQIGLTPAGALQVNEVGKHLFSLLKLIENKGVTRSYFDELKCLAEQRFRFQNKTNESSLAKQIAHSMHRYADVEVLSTPRRYGEYEPDVINRFLKSLRPDNMHLLVVDPKHSSPTKTPWFEVDYTLEKMPTEMLNGCGNMDVSGLLSLPEPNRFIPLSFALADVNADKADAQDKPVQIIDEPGLQLWHRTVLQFRQPKAAFYCDFVSPSANDCAKSAVLTALLIRLLNEEVTTALYPASLAGLSFSIRPSAQGWSLKLSGFGDKQLDFLAAMEQLICALQIDQAQFDVHYQSLLSSLQSRAKELPFRVALESAYDALLSSRWPQDQQRAALESICLGDLNQHAESLLKPTTLQILSLGQLSQADSIRKARELLKLVPERAKKMPPQRQRVAQLNPAKWMLITPSSAHGDSAIVLIFQDKHRELKALAATQLLGTLIHPHYFQALRTQAKVGYVVMARALDLANTPGLGFIVQSNVHSAGEVVESTLEFLRGFVDTLAAMDDSAYQSNKQGLMAQLLRDDRQLSDMAARYWTELDYGVDDFSTRERLVAHMQAMDKPTLCDYYKDIVEQKRSAVLLSACFGDHSAVLPQIVETD